MKNFAVRSSTAASRIFNYPETLHAVVATKDGQLLFVTSPKSPIKKYDYPSGITLDENSAKHLDNSKYSSVVQPRDLEKIQTTFDGDDLRKFAEYLDPLIARNLHLKDSSTHLGFYNYCLSDSSIISRNRSKAFSMFPLFAKLVLSDNPQIKKLVESVDEGISFDSLKKYFGNPNWATNGFLKRTRHASNLNFIETLGTALSYGLTDKEQNFDSTTYNLRVSNLPIAADDNKALWTTVNSIYGMRGSCEEKDKHKMILNIGLGDWQRNVVENASHFYGSTGRYFSSIINDLLLPAYLSKLHSFCSIRGIELPPSFMEYCDKNYQNFVSDCEKFVSNNIASNMTPGQLANYSDKLTRASGIIDAQKPIHINKRNEVIKNGRTSCKYEDEWHPLFKDMTIGNFRFEVITNSEELTLEADIMSNCIAKGSHGEYHKGRWHVVRIYDQRDENHRASMRLEGKEGIIEQCHGIKNSSLTPELEEVVETFKEMIRNKQIPLNAKVGQIKKSDILVTDTLGFDPLNTQQRNRVLLAYQQADVLPQFLRDTSYEEFATRIRLNEFLDKEIEDFVNKNGLQANSPTPSPQSPKSYSNDTFLQI